MSADIGDSSPSGPEWLVEQRYRAVLEVLDSSPVTEVAVRYGVSRQSVYAWKARYEAGGLDGLREVSRRPRTTPTRTAATTEAMICEMRRAHAHWGARRICYEVGLRDVQPAPSRMTVHRVLVRNGFVLPQEQHHKRKYKSWQREAPMHLWQLDLVGGVYLTDGRECKILTGVDDHSRYVVVAAVLAVPSGRAVADAFTAAMRRHGVPSEVLTDNGKQFTGRFTKPRPAEVLFERVCRENGITARLTRPRSPTTTGKVERFHKTLRREFLDEAGRFTDLPAAQAALNAWVHTYNHARPHQSLDMATPGSLFRPNDPTPTKVVVPPPAEPAPVAAGTPRAVLTVQSAQAVQFDTVIAASGLLSILPRAQRIKMGGAYGGQAAQVWVDEFSVHIVIDGRLVKTVASNLTEADLTELLMRGAHPAGPPPAPPSPAGIPSGRLPADAVIEVDRTVDENGVADIGGHRLKIGTELARRRVTLRLDGHLIHVVCDGTLAKTMPSPITADQRTTLRGARIAGAPLPPPAGPVSVQRRVPNDGVIMVTRQQLRVGRTHAGKTVTIHVEDTHFRVVHDGEQLSLHPRTEQRPVTRWRAYAPRSGT
jgi:transposase InsO family protein